MSEVRRPFLPIPANPEEMAKQGRQLEAGELRTPIYDETGTKQVGWHTYRASEG